jgi:hypothetical protein
MQKVTVLRRAKHSWLTKNDYGNLFLQRFLSPVLAKQIFVKEFPVYLPH